MKLRILDLDPDLDLFESSKGRAQQPRVLVQLLVELGARGKAWGIWIPTGLEFGGLGKGEPGQNAWAVVAKKINYKKTRQQEEEFPLKA